MFSIGLVSFHLFFTSVLIRDWAKGSYLERKELEDPVLC
jgi:hypothetical protein